MLTSHINPRFWCAIFACVLVPPACTPTYDWRDVHGASIPFTVLMPAKPTTQSRPVNLAGVQVTMNMTVAEVNGVMFAVGTAATPDSAQAVAAIKAMKTALVNNINGTIKSEKASSSSHASPGNTGQLTSIEIEASGAPARAGDAPRQLFAQFIAKDKWVYEAIVTGSERTVTRDAVDTFFSSFKPN
jgi:hypothetical protein